MSVARAGGARLAGMALAIGLVASCSGERAGDTVPAPTPPPLSPGIFRGHAIHGHEVREFRPCGSDSTLWLVDESGALWTAVRELGHGAEAEAFVVLEGANEPAPAEGLGVDHAGALHVTSVLYVGGEGPDCDHGWGEFRFLARGNEPFWSAGVSTEGLRVSRLGEPDLAWPDVAVEKADAGFRCVGADVPGHPAVELVIRRERCRDSMSGAYFGYSAELHLGDAVLTGCALPGDG